MKTIYIRTLNEAKTILPALEIIRIALMLKQGHSVTLTDEANGVEYVFEPSKEGATQ